jgi:hypothetical protein
MWWLLGLINVVIVLLFAWFYHKKIKEGEKWLMYDKVALVILLLLAFLSGFLGTLCFGGIIVYLIIDFVLYTLKNR